MANKHTKRWSISLAIKKIQIKTTMRYHYICTRIVKLKKTDNVKCWWGHGTTGPSHTACRNATLENSFAVSYKVKHRCTIWPSNSSSLGNLPEKNETICSYKKAVYRASLVAQWLRVCLLMQGMRVRALVWEDPTCHGATGPVSHNYRACASGACAPQQERPR